MKVRLVTPPAAEPVSVDEAKAHLRLETTADDTYVTELISAAREWVEGHCWRGFVTQTWELVLEQFPDCDHIVLPKGQLDSIVSLTYVDADGVTQTADPSLYVADTVSKPGRLVLAYGESWPSTRCQWDAVKVQYKVGVGASSVPKSVKQAVLLLVSQMYEHRTPEVSGTIVSKVQFAVESLLRRHRLVRF